jgi:hypothetical protein
LRRFQLLQKLERSDRSQTGDKAQREPMQDLFLTYDGSSHVV